RDPGPDEHGRLRAAGDHGEGRPDGRDRLLDDGCGAAPPGRCTHVHQRRARDPRGAAGRVAANVHVHGPRQARRLRRLLRHLLRREGESDDARHHPGGGVAVDQRVPACHDASAPAPAPTRPVPELRPVPLVGGWPRAAVVLAVALVGVGAISGAWIAVSPFDAAAFGGLTVPVVLASGVADGLNPCAFALLVLFATYTLTLVNSVTADGSPTLEARRRLLGAGSLYVGAVWITYFVIG